MDGACGHADGGWNAVAIDADDNVAVALAELVGSARVHRTGTYVDVPLLEPIPMGHKLAIRPIKIGTPVLKYGQPIGLAKVDISAGEHVHVQNVASSRASVSSASPLKK